MIIRHRLARLTLTALAVNVGLATLSSQSAPAQSTGLKIVIVEGEAAVNIIQQKTAVAPIVEVRDRNDQPVAGAVVNFAIRGGRATFGGARTLSVTTDAAGRAVAAGLTPTTSGAVQIGASAAFQGQTAVITIAQTNVLTAAQAAAVSTAGAGGSAGGGVTAGGGAGGGGGGISATTIGLVGAAAAGAVVATQVVRSGPRLYSGTFALDWGVGCLVERMMGTLEVELDMSSETPGTALSAGSVSVQDGSSIAVSRPANCNIQINGNWGMGSASLAGTVDRFVGHAQDAVTSRVNTTIDRTYDFQGGWQNDTVVGTFTLTWRDRNNGLASSGTTSGTLNRQ